MPDVHVPHLDEHEDAAEPAAASAHSAQPRGPSFFKIALEVALIATGVFLGMAGEQWREHARHNEMADESLRRFRAEIATNRKAVDAVKDYHTRTKKGIDAYLAADAAARGRIKPDVLGLQPVSFEHTAWDLALVTQSLAYIDSDLAFSLARLYNLQQEYSQLSGAILQALYVRPPGENLDVFFAATQAYFGDVVLMEPRLVKMYDELERQIDRALGERSERR